MDIQQRICFLVRSPPQAQETPEVATAIEAGAAPTTDDNKLGDERVVRPLARGLCLFSFLSPPFP